MIPVATKNYGASATMPDDDRQADWAAQRASRGFDDTELWSLDHSFAQYMVDELGSSTNHAKAYRAFRLMAQDDFCVPSTEKEAEIEEGLDAFFAEIRAAHHSRASGGPSGCSLGRIAAEFLLPRMRAFKEMTHGFPGHLGNFDRWVAILEEIIDGLSPLEIADFDDLSEADAARVEAGFRLLRLYLRHLWD